MWIPTPIYERLPLLWLLMGILFIGYGLYHGLEISVAEGAAIAGIVCCFYGFGLRIVRIRHRREHANEDSAPEPAGE
jgi:hypothetical protein